MLLLGGRSPPKILFAKDTGRLYQTELMPVREARTQGLRTTHTCTPAPQLHFAYRTEATVRCAARAAAPQNYNDRGQLERTEAVPFRLTRNLAAFFTAFGVEGVFTAAMVTAAQASAAHRAAVRSSTPVHASTPAQLPALAHAPS
jgi:transformation/transcription domain-associated protein